MKENEVLKILKSYQKPMTAREIATEIYPDIDSKEQLIVRIQNLRKKLNQLANLKLCNRVKKKKTVKTQYYKNKGYTTKVAHFEVNM